MLVVPELSGIRIFPLIRTFFPTSILILIYKFYWILLKICYNPMSCILYLTSYCSTGFSSSCFFTFQFWSFRYITTTILMNFRNFWWKFNLYGTWCWYFMFSGKFYFHIRPKSFMFLLWWIPYLNTLRSTLKFFPFRFSKCMKNFSFFLTIHPSMRSHLKSNLLSTLR